LLLSRAERNRELAQRGFALFSTGDFGAAIATVHPQIEWYLTFHLPDLPAGKDVYRGHDEVLTVWESFKSVWEELVIDVEEFLHADDERLVFRARFIARGAASGIEIDRVVFYAARIEDDMLAYLRSHDDEASARRDLGLDVDDG
jgi:ketosteroid isomerase-like protein